MKLRLVVRDAGTAESDVILTGEPGTTVGELASAIAGQNERALTLAVLHADAVIPLPPDQRLGDDLLAQGSTVRVIESTDQHGAQDPIGTLVLHSGQWGNSMRRRPLFPGVTTIGIDDSCDVVIADPTAGPGRVGIFAGATIEIFDLDSGPGVQVDGDVADRVRVHGSATLTIGRTEIVVADARRGGARSTGPRELLRPPRVVPRFVPRSFPAPLDEETFERNRAAIEERIAEQREAAEREWPGPEAVVAQVADGGPLVWTRRPEHEEFGAVRVGIGAAPRADRLTVPVSAGRGVDWRWEELDRQTATIAEVPLAVSLREAGSIGVVGAPAATAPVVRALLMQLGGLHGPEQATLAAVVGRRRVDEFEWLKWLPHTWAEYGSLGEAPRLATGRLAADALLSRLETWEPDGDGFAVLLIAEDAPVDRARVLRLAEEGRTSVHVIWLSESLDTTPGSCHAVLDVTTGSLIDAHRGRIVPVSFDALSAADALRAARALAGMRDAGGTYRAVAPPTRVDLVDLIGRDVAESPRVIEGRWERGRTMLQGGNPLSAVVGSTGGRPLSFVDSAVTIVGGGTGSGTSSFLQSLLLSLASSYPPDQLALVLVGSRAGYAPVLLRELPHTLALVTDLTPQSAERLLTQLRTAARQLGAQQRRSHRLIVVIEDATGIEAEHPGLLLALTRIANQSQSGVSLIIGTQRPSLLPEDVRRSARTTVAFRTTDAEDSRALISSERAVALPLRAPGRAIRWARGRIEEFQGAYSDGWAASRRTLATATAADFGFGEERPRDDGATVDRTAASAEKTDAELLADGIASAFAKHPVASGIQLPGELSADYDLLDLLTQDDSRIALGMQEDPEDTTQSVAVFAPDEHRNLAILGPARSGRTTALRTLAISAAFTRDGVPIEVYAVGAQLEDLAILEHIGAVVDGDDGYRIRRLLTMLGDRIEEREKSGVGSRYSALRGRKPELPDSVHSRILLLLDEPRLLQDRTSVDSDDADARLLRRILRLGHFVGVHVVVAGLENLLRGDLASLIPNVIELRPEGVHGPRRLSAGGVPGRGVWNGREVQLARVTDHDAVPEIAAAQLRSGVVRPPGIEPAPAPLRVSELARPADGRIVLGLDPEDLQPISFARTGCIELYGRFSAERATAMAVVAQALRHAGDTRPRVLLAGPRSTAGKVGLWDSILTTSVELGPLLESAADAPVALFIEMSTLAAADAGLVDGILAESESEFAKAEAGESLFLIELDTDRAGIRSYTRHLRGARRSIVLSPRSLDLSILGAKAPSTPPVGTVVPAYWVEDGTPQALLLPRLEPDPLPAAPSDRSRVVPGSRSSTAPVPLSADETLLGDDLFGHTIVPRLVVSTGESYPLAGTTIVGRRPRKTLDIDNPELLLVTVPSPQRDIARNHVEFLRTRSMIVARDLHTTNGTRLIRLGQVPTRLPSDAYVALRPDDVIDLGDEVRLSFEDCEPLGWRAEDGRSADSGLDGEDSGLDGDVAADAPPEA